MSRIRSLCWIVAAALVPAIPVAGQNAATSQGADRTYTLTVKGSVGDLIRYKTQTNMKMEMKGANGESPLPISPESTSDLVHKVKTVAVRPDGTMVQVMTVEHGTMKVMGQSVDLPSTPPVTMEVDRFGRASVKGADKLPGAQIISQFMNMNQVPSSGFIMPDHPVKVGDSWDTKIAAPGGVGEMKITSTLLGTEEVGGRQTLKLKQVTEMPLNIMMGADGKPTTDESKAGMVMKGSVGINSIANILADNCRLVKVVGDVDMKMEMTMKGEAAASSPFGSMLKMTGAGTYTSSLLSEGKVQPPAVKPASPTRNKTGTTAKKKTGGTGK